MEVTIGSTIRVQYPSRELIQWANKHLTLVNPDYVKKMRMGLWTGNTPQTISLFERRGDFLILPFGTLKSVYPLLKHVTNIFPDPTPVDYGTDTVPLYDYQRYAVEEMHKSRYGILQSAAGSGKTQMGIALIQRYKRTALWITHTADLLNQSLDRAKQFIDPSLLGTITAGKVNIGKGITFATVQTLCKLDLDLYKDLWDVVIVDECHHVSGSPTTVTQFYKVLNHLNARHKYGLSATVHRSDGLIQATYAMLGEVKYIVPDEAVAGKIMKVGVHPEYTKTPISEDCLNPDGTLNYTSMITYLCGDEERNRMILTDIIGEQDHPCLILSDRLEHLETLMYNLPPALQMQAVMVTGKMTSKKEKAKREAALEAMRKGEKNFLFATYALAKEGLDIPRLERLFLTTPVKDEAVVIQSVGRIARTCEGKQFPVAYDFVDNIPFCYRAYRERVKHYRKIGATCV